MDALQHLNTNLFLNFDILLEKNQEKCTESYLILRTKLLADLCFVYKKTGNVFISPQKLKLGLINHIDFEM